MLKPEIRNKILNAFIVGCMFVIAGYFIPQVYFQYLDTTNYYTINSITFDKPSYKSGEIMIATFYRTVVTNITANSLRELILVKTILGEDNDDVVYRVNTNVILNAGTVVKQTPFQLPDKLDDGTYFWRLAVTYQIHGISKITQFDTPTFNIKN